MANVKLTHRWPKRSGSGYISENYQRRLERAGVKQAQYRDKNFKLATARGHAETPEHPREATKHPERYQKYRATIRAIVKEGDHSAIVEIANLTAPQRRSVAQHWNTAIRLSRPADYLGVPSPYRKRTLKSFEGKKYGPYELETRLDELMDMALQTDLSFEKMYPKVK
jgi:hypothetical protein